ncbi:MAG: shikimate dehydrogenase [Chloroherpetonaceae bacterium]|nr:shikimate dehydrogenase [Chloroherpetonaceae bacterium]
MKHAKKILGLIGHQVGYSLSPFLHNIAFEHLGLPYFYTLFEVYPPERLTAALDGAKALGFLGFNITIPYKERIVPYLDALSAEASEVKAVNTLLNQDGQWIGYNTDIFGFAEPLLPFKSQVNGSEVVVFGAGGAARAVVQALRQFFKPKQVWIVARDEAKAELLKEHFERRSKSLKLSACALNEASLESVLGTARLLINATPVGTDSTALPQLKTARLFPAEWKIWSPEKIAYDLVYRPQMTPFLYEAQAHGARIISGLEMLLAQGAKSFKIWTGQELPRDVVRAALQQQLKESEH